MRPRTHRSDARCCLRASALALALASGCFSESPAADTGAASLEEGSSGGGSPSSGDESSTADASTGHAETTTPIVTHGSLDSGEVTGGSSSSSGSGVDGSTTEPDDTSGSSGDASSSTGEPEPLTIDQLVPGDLVITEVMWNPYCAGDSCEWIELLNTTDQVVNLLDLYVQDIDHNVGTQGRVTTDVLVGPGELAVITRGLNAWSYLFAADAVYGPNPGLNNTEPDTVLIRSEAMVLDEIPTLPFDVPQGTAWSLDPTAMTADDNDNAFNWCLASTVLDTTGTDEYGTPLETNPAC